MQKMQETQFPSLSQEDPLEKEMATQSSILAWKIPWMKEPGRGFLYGQSKPFNLDGLKLFLIFCHGYPSQK